MHVWEGMKSGDEGVRCRGMGFLFPEPQWGVTLYNWEPEGRPWEALGKYYIFV